MKWPAIIFLCSFLHVQTGFSQGIIDSLAGVIQARNISERVDLLNELAASYAEKDIPTAQYLAEKGFHLAESLNDKSGKAESARLLGILNYYKGNFEMAEYYNLISRNLAVALHKSGLERSINTTLALVYTEDSAIDKAIELYNRNVDIDLAENNRLNLGVDYQNLGIAYDVTGNVEAALRYFKEARDIFISEGQQDRIVRIYDLIGKLYTGYNRDSARYYLSAAYALSAKYAAADILNVLWDYSDYYLKTKRTDSAIYFLRMALSKSGNPGNTFGELTTLERLSDAYAGSGDFRNAYYFHTEYIRLKDSIALKVPMYGNSERLKNLEAENKNQTIELIRKEAQVNQGKWVDRKIAYFLSAGGILLILFISLSFYFRYKLFNKSIHSAEKLREELSALTAMVTEKEEMISRLKANLLQIGLQDPGSGSGIAGETEFSIMHADELPEILRHAADKLGVDRTGLFLQNEYGQLIVLGDCDRITGTCRQGDILTSADCPKYFKELRNLLPWMTADKMNDPRYAGLSGKAHPSGNIARMDVPLFIERKLIGIYYAERNGESSGWNDHEQLKIKEYAGRFVPFLARMLTLKSYPQDEFQPDLAYIGSVLKKSGGMMIIKNSDGLVHQAFPEAIDFAKGLFQPTRGNNWFDQVAEPDKNRLLEFYKSYGTDRVASGKIIYSMHDLQGEVVRVEEQITEESAFQGDRKLVSMIHVTTSDDDHQNLKTQINSLKAVIASLAHAIFLTDQHGKIILLNPAAEKLSGYSSDELLSSQISILIDVPDSVFSGKSSNSVHQDIKLKSKNGDPINCRLLAAAFRVNQVKYFNLEIFPGSGGA